MEPSDELVLSLRHGLSILDLGGAILIGRDLLHRLSSILQAGVSPELLDETKTYAIFNVRVRSEGKDPRIGILDLESGKILYVIIPSIAFTPAADLPSLLRKALEEQGDSPWSRTLQALVGLVYNGRLLEELHVRTPF